MNDYYSIAIDGPSGAGKSTIARAAAEHFGFLYVDTGAIYRTVGVAVRNRGIEPTDSVNVIAMLPSLRIQLIHGEDGLQHMILDGEDVTDTIRQPDISMYASAVSAIPEVRAYLMDTQRNLAASNHVIMDGRDIGTVVLPHAGLKIFLTATAEDRARRRYLELIGRGIETNYEEVYRDIQIRDKNDSSRAAAPLRPADDALFLDTTGYSFEQSCNLIFGIIQERFGI